MRQLFLLFGVTILVAGCAPSRSAPFVDCEFGRTNQAAWDAQIVRKDHPYAGQVPEEMAGVNAEESMAVRTRSFAEKPKKSEVFRLGLTKQ